MITHSGSHRLQDWDWWRVQLSFACLQSTHVYPRSSFHKSYKNFSKLQGLIYTCRYTQSIRLDMGRNFWFFGCLLYEWKKWPTCPNLNSNNYILVDFQNFKILNYLFIILLKIFKVRSILKFKGSKQKNNNKFGRKGGLDNFLKMRAKFKDLINWKPFAKKK